MSIAAPESVVDCGVVGVTGDASASPQENLPPINSHCLDPGLAIDARIRLALNRLKSAQVKTPTTPAPQSAL